MRILLVRPPVPKQTMGLKHVMICEPLELEYVAAGCRGHDVEILDLIVERGFGKRLRRFRPNVIGTSAYVTGVNEVIKLCREAKRWNPDCLTVVGGVHAACAPESFADASVDCIVLGDGTTVMPEILRARAAGTPLASVPGLAFPRGDGVEFSPERRYMTDPDALPFPRRDLVARLRDRYYYLFHRPVATMKTTWGCWYRCNFCYTWRITGGPAFSRTPESIAEELAGIETEDVYIVDDIFLARPERLARLASLLRERGIRKKYLAYARADFVAENEPIVAEWAGLGLTAVFLGLEAATNPELDSLAKQTTVDDNRRAIAILRRHGIDTYGSLITQPEYEPEDWDRLWRFIEENGLYYLNLSPLTPLPGTDLWAERRREMTVPPRAHALFDLTHVLLPTRMPLRDYYRALVRTYVRTVLDLGRAERLTLRTRPPVWSRDYLRLWLGAVRIWIQMRGAHRHHRPRELARAMDRGEPLPARTRPAPPKAASGSPSTPPPETRRAPIEKAPEEPRANAGRAR
ncbi:MAG TPA: radical SAM protein [Candidatus Eisenbacteria bacterium]|nr:radical SAM protein [Candidatus Eisenbacteria bacterium]